MLELERSFVVCPTEAHPGHRVMLVLDLELARIDLRPAKGLPHEARRELGRKLRFLRLRHTQLQVQAGRFLRLGGEYSLQ